MAGKMRFAWNIFWPALSSGILLLILAGLFVKFKIKKKNGEEETIKVSFRGTDARGNRNY